VKAARELLAELTEVATTPGASYLHSWRKGDVVMWDNRATMHRGRPWPVREPRYMVRSTISATAVDGLEAMHARSFAAGGSPRIRRKKCNHLSGETSGVTHSL
jgi:alpha-ketoglutarate-dependent 2,4-dichlorophenoxyacetate dioxygenase